MMFCRNCGSTVQESTNFCQDCGEKVIKNETEAHFDAEHDTKIESISSINDIENKDKAKIALTSIIVFVCIIVIANVINKFYATTFIEQSITFSFGKATVKHYFYHFIQQIPIIFIFFPAAVILFSKLLKIDKDKQWFVYAYTSAAFVIINIMGWLFWDTKFVLCLINAAMYFSVVCVSGTDNPYFKQFTEEE